MPLSKALLQQASLLTRTADERSLDKGCESAIEHLISAANTNRPILVCGNGGSAADAAHIVGELVGRYLLERAPINAISLCDNAATITAWSNDYDFRTIFSRQVRAHGVAGGISWALSTSGNSPNVIEALKTAQSLSLRTIVMTGEGGGLCRQYADVLLSVPSTVTAEIQQVHICLYHYICERVEAALQ